MATLLQAQPFIDQINSNGEDATLWVPIAVGSYDPVTGFSEASQATNQDASGVVWRQEATTVLVIRSAQDILTESFGLMPRGSLAVRLNPNGITPSRLMRLVLLEDGRILREFVNITRTASTSTDNLKHPFVTAIETVRQVDTSYTNVTLGNNNDPMIADTITWGSGSKPADNTPYGVAYTHRPVYELAWQTGSLALMGAEGILMPITVPLVLAGL